MVAVVISFNGNVTGAGVTVVVLSSVERRVNVGREMVMVLLMVDIGV